MLRLIATALATVLVLVASVMTAVAQTERPSWVPERRCRDIAPGVQVECGAVRYVPMGQPFVYALPRTVCTRTDSSEQPTCFLTSDPDQYVETTVLEVARPARRISALAGYEGVDVHVRTRVLSSPSFARVITAGVNWLTESGVQAEKGDLDPGHPAMKILPADRTITGAEMDGWLATTVPVGDATVMIVAAHAHDYIYFGLAP